SNRFAEQTIKLLYTSVSFTVGESAPLWVIAIGALLAPVILWQTLRKRPEWWPLLSISAGIAYLGAGTWVSFAFIPARMLFVLPFFSMLVARRTWLCIAMVFLSI